MKYLFLVVLGIFSLGLVNAQKARKTGDTNASTALNLNSQVNRARKANGTALIHTEQGRFRLYATFANNKVSGYYAIDQNGKKINPVYPTGGAQALFCQVCINSGGTNQTCYEVDCSKIPPPIKKATANSSQ